MYLQERQAAIEVAGSANEFLTPERNLPKVLDWLNKEADIDTPSPADFKDRQYTIRFGRKVMRIVSNQDTIREVAECDGSFGFIGSDYTDNWGLGPKPRSELAKQVSLLAFAELFTLEPQMRLFIPEPKTLNPDEELNVVTSYQNSLIKFIREQGLILRKFKKVNGKVEGYVGRDGINAGFDIVESGGTLKANGLLGPDKLKDNGIEIALSWHLEKNKPTKRCKFLIETILNRVAITYPSGNTT